MASIASTIQAPPPTAALSRRAISCPRPVSTVFSLSPRVPVLRLAPKISHNRVTKWRVLCAVAQPDTLKVVQSTIAKQLSVEEFTVTPQTKFADLGADSLDTVEIMMALEEKFGVSVGESGAESIATVQDAADLIEKVKAAAP
ncbi:hypothetical protein SASPL_111415 [Salvia splendens]|uniref:Acyl carrier protein n=1 Tax=Salvia splendens TaxID=180675 RepID=A0A8X8YBV9_SALSN|nr:acyl carrier protein-like [Salvia splendens]KAG6427175.1 hypothetical protein SASPL_111415 [Salvia splendens]